DGVRTLVRKVEPGHLAPDHGVHVPEVGASGERHANPITSAGGAGGEGDRMRAQVVGLHTLVVLEPAAAQYHAAKGPHPAVAPPPHGPAARLPPPPPAPPSRPPPSLRSSRPTGSPGGSRSPCSPRPRP